MTAALPPHRTRLLASFFLMLPGATCPALAQPVDLRASNIGPADARKMVAPALPIPSVSVTGSAIDFLRAARSALARGRTGETQEALERAETRLLDGSAGSGIAGPSSRPALTDIRAARRALTARDRAASTRAIDAAIAALAAPATVVVVPGSADAAPPPRQPAASAIVAAAVPAAPPPVTKALRPGRWEMRGVTYVWVPPDTELRRVDERAWLEGRNVWKDGAWVWVPAHYGFE